MTNDQKEKKNQKGEAAGFREFWITDHTDNSGFTVDTEFNHRRHYGSCNVYHVIEIGALDELQKERDELKAELSAANELLANNEGRVKKIVDEHLSLENDKLRADLAVAVEAIKKAKEMFWHRSLIFFVYENSGTIKAVSVSEFERQMDETLAKIGAGDK